MDFFKAAHRSRKGIIEIYPKFIIRSPSSDLMIRGGDFYAIYIPETGFWSTSEQDVIRMVDNELDLYFDQNQAEFTGKSVRILHMWDAESGVIDTWHKYCQKQMRDNFHSLDEKLIFSNTEVKRTDYASKKLAYPLEFCEIPAYDKLMSVLYSPEERHKIEWAIGSIVSGDSKKLQKFLVLYGAAGTGKSTVLNIIEALFDGYSSVFDSRALGSSSSSFALEPFKCNPLVAIQHDGDLSRIEDNTRLNSLVSHERMTVNNKFEKLYSQRFKAFLFMGTNKPVRITDAKSGLIRRLIDVTPTGNKVPAREYDKLMKEIEFELGGIAYHCLEVYKENPKYYDSYIPLSMMGASNDFYNFIEDSLTIFMQDDSTTLKASWEMYKTYVEDARVAFPLSRIKFKEELKNYFREFYDQYTMGDGTRVRSYYNGFRLDRFKQAVPEYSNLEKDCINELGLKLQPSVLDETFKDCPAQYATEDETPKYKWANVKTKLSDISTDRLHYVKVPKNLIVIDFDIPENGEKSLYLNIEAALQWPQTYAEVSKGGKGIHLHYFYDGDVEELENLYSEYIEIKTFTGGSSLRRKLTYCNDIPIATLNSGLPLKQKGAKMINFDSVKSEKGLRNLIIRNLKKEIHPGTKPSIDFIFKILEDAYNSGLKYDVSDMRPNIIAFAAGSTHQAEYCMKMVPLMKFSSEECSEPMRNDDAPIIFYDVEVFPNLFVICWKALGEGKNVVKMINPKPYEVEELMKYRLVGFNCRKYDNHIMYGRLLGYSEEALYNLSQNIIVNGKGFFGEAYNISYTDIYDFITKKQSLKKYEIELGIHHQELGLPWDKPVDPKLWDKVAEYCVNDVLATEAVWNARQADFSARKILADLSGLTVNDPNRLHIIKILVGDKKQADHVYTDLATGKSDRGYKEFNKFPGYEMVEGEDRKLHNMFRGTDVGFGGYVYAEPGVHNLVALLDVGNMHGASIINLDKFGVDTQNYIAIREARMAIKEGINNGGDFSKASEMLGGKLKPYLNSIEEADALQQALKLILNSTYGIAAATFDNALRDKRDVNNIIALRGALFMRTLQDEVADRGFTVAHIKTDSIKIPNATKEIIDFVIDFGRKYGYEFEHEATYEKMCLVNDAVYIAQYAPPEQCERMYGYVPSDNRKHFKKHSHPWTATGAQFQVPYVFKDLFSKEPIEFEDMCETKSVSKGDLYLDMNEGMGEGEHNYVFVGRVGAFCPVKSGIGGGDLLRVNDGKYYAATGTKGYKWMESEYVRRLGDVSVIDQSYYISMVKEAKKAVEEFAAKVGKTFEWFVDETPLDEMSLFLNVPEDLDDEVPWVA